MRRTSKGKLRFNHETVRALNRLELWAARGGWKETSNCTTTSFMTRLCPETADSCDPCYDTYRCNSAEITCTC